KPLDILEKKSWVPVGETKETTIHVEYLMRNIYYGLCVFAENSSRNDRSQEVAAYEFILKVDNYLPSFYEQLEFKQHGSLAF
ncbi:unnamed protein product, partial [Rotaria sordida]